MAISLTINGTARQYTGDPAQPLLWYLRDSLSLTGTKFGCGIGTCGACTVHVDGSAMQACVLPMAAVAGRRVTTIEGLSATGDHPVQRAWATVNVPQCGYCQPGQVMAAAALLQQSPHPTDAEVDAAMSAVICRCGTYTRIREAIRSAAGMPGAASEGR